VGVELKDWEVGIDWDGCAGSSNRDGEEKEEENEVAERGEREKKEKGTSVRGYTGDGRG